MRDRHLYTVHKTPVRFQRCLACMVAKQGPCGDHKATWLCRSRLTDAAPGVDVHNGAQYFIMHTTFPTVPDVDVHNGAQYFIMHTVFYTVSPNLH